LANLTTLSVLALFTSFASMAYELVIAQTLAILTDEVIWWESCSIGFFIAATGLGVFLYEHMEKISLTDFFMKAEILLALVGLLALPFIFFLHIVYRIYIVDYLAHGHLSKPLNWVMFACQAPNLFIGVLSGFELRVLFELIENKTNGQNTRSQIVILVIYHLGALVASLTFAVFILKKIEPFQLAFFASLLNGAVALWCLKTELSSRFSESLSSVQQNVQQKPQLRPALCQLRPALCLLVLASYGIVQWGWGPLKELQIKNFYFNNVKATMNGGVFEKTGPIGLSKIKSWADQQASVQRHFTAYQVVDVVPDAKDSEVWKLFLDGHFQFSSDTERFYHETIAHVPIMITGKVPENVLVLGGGDGLLARELLKYGDRIRQIKMVEIDKEILELAKSLPFSTLNASSLTHRRLDISIADAFTWLRQSRNQFDAIYIDFPYPYTFEGLRIYSTEFLSLVARHLSKDGFVIMDIPIFGAGDPNWQDHVSSLLARSGFPKVLAFEGGYGETFLLGVTRERALPFAYKDLGIRLETLNQKWFASEENHLELTHGSTKDVNSILKPRRISLPDVWK